MTEAADNDRRPQLRRRLAAAGIDYLVILAWIAVVTVIGVVTRALAPDLASALFADPLRAEAVGFALLTLPVGLYFAIFEASSSGATLGKRRVGLRVADRGGRRIGAMRSAVRTGVKLLPWELSHFAVWQLSAGAGGDAPAPIVALVLAWGLVGVSLVCFVVTRERRALHDLAAGTVVVETT